MGTPNWAKLYSEGRCMAVGVAFKEEEIVAIHKLGIPVEYVRDGIITAEDYEKAKKKDDKEGKPLERLSRADLTMRANDAGVDFTPQTPDYILISLIEKAKAKKSEKKSVSKKK